MNTEKLFSLIDQSGPERIEGSPCWLYKGKVDGRGRGQIWLDGQNWNARRACYLAVMGELPEVELRRICGNNECVRPEHQRLTEFTRGFNSKRRHGFAHRSRRAVFA